MPLGTVSKLNRAIAERISADVTVERDRAASAYCQKCNRHIRSYQRDYPVPEDPTLNF